MKYLTLFYIGNGSDVFGSDICTCKPYLVFAIEECIRCAQRGGVGLVVYFRKEGRALGEVTKSVSSLQFFVCYF
jgi:GTP cyclohydrolase II